MSTKSTNITFTDDKVAQNKRWQANGHKGGVIWFTGLSGSGKSTLAFELEQALFEREYQVFVLDGDNVRHGLCSDLGFSAQDRAENIRRVGEVSALFAETGMVVIAAFISPYRADRDLARSAAKSNFHEVYVHADLSVCESRDPKGLYVKARKGEIPDFTGISAPYEEPGNPQLTVETGDRSVDDCVTELVTYVKEKFAL
jgi:bifunctional enzyme CysN/CysC